MTPSQRACDVCKSPMDEDVTDFVVEMDGEQLTLEDVPVWVCPQCDSVIVDEDIIEAVEDMLAHLDEVMADANGDRPNDASSDSG